MRFTRGKFNRLINNLGQDMLWRRRHACACIDPTNGAPDHRCPLCFGRGHVWEAPVEAVAAPANQETQKSWATFGLYEAGDVVVTIPENSPMWDAGPFDRVAMLNVWDHFSMTLHRGAHNERLSFQPRTIDSVFWLDANKKQVKGRPPVVSEDGKVTFKSGGPRAGTAYSISGTRTGEYFIFQSLPRNRNMHGGMRLPKHVVLRRYDLLGR